MRGTDPIRAVLADDHTLVRAGLRRLLGGLEDVEVVAEACDGDELLRILAEVEADVVLTDIGMPGTDGITALRRIRERDPAVKVIVVSMDDSAQSIRTALACGANGYVRKDAPDSELATAIRNVMASGSHFGGAVMQRLAQPVAPALTELLTQRQLRILALLANGKTTKQIAFEMDLSTKTVDVHRRRIMELLQANDVASLTRLAVRHGLVEP